LVEEYTKAEGIVFKAREQSEVDINSNCESFPMRNMNYIKLEQKKKASNKLKPKKTADKRV
jgi:hypothetical protein